MEQITIENINQEIRSMLKSCQLTQENLRRLVLLFDAKKFLHKMNLQFTEEESVDWAKHMNPPARWTMEQTSAVMHQHGYHHDPCEFFAVMNSLASDYGKTMEKHGADKVDIWAELANDFICDKDAVDNKVAAYYAEIVCHL